MKDRRVREKFYNTSDRELTFTKEDRNEVFEQINKMEKNNATKNSFVFHTKKLAPVTASLFVIGLCMFLFFPSNLSETITPDIKESNARESVVKEDEVLITTLFMVKDDNDRLPINLLLTYNKEKKEMKVLSIPRDTYAPMSKVEKNTSYDKLSHAYVNGTDGTEDVRKIVSNIFDVPIDYTAVINLETLSSIIDSVNGIEYVIQEDLRVRAISTVAFDFKKGTHRLNGEEVVALLMDATVGSSLDEEDLLNLMNAVINQTINKVTQSELKQFTTKIDGDIPIQLLENKIEIPKIQLVSLIDGMRGTKKGEAYYIEFEEDFLKTISEELVTFN